MSTRRRQKKKEKKEESEEESEEEEEEEEEEQSKEDGGGHDELSLLASRLVSHHKRVSLLRHILSFHETRNPKDYIKLRSSSKLFHRALQPPPLWTTFPCSNHATLQSLVDRLEELRGEEESSGNVPSLLFIEEGEFSSAEGDYIIVNKPLSIYGAGRGKTTLVGVGLKIYGKKSEGIIEIGDLKIKGGKDAGVFVYEGMNVIVRRCSVENCRHSGVYVQKVDVSCDDLQVVGCGYSGVCVGSNATITLSGEGTSIQENGKENSDDYGLKTYYSTSKIILVAPLTKEQISSNNGGGGNWGGDGTIEQVSK
jgi:hypothetical protein